LPDIGDISIWQKRSAFKKDSDAEMRKAILIISCLLCLHKAASCSGDGGTESPFIFGAGAHELAMGSTGLTICDASTAPFWNASRLARASRFSVGSFYSRLYMPGVSYQYLGLALPTLDYGTFGVGIFRLGVDDIEKRDSGNLLLGKFDEQRLGIYLGYGTTIAGYDLGASLNIENHTLDSYRATSSPGLNLAISRQIETSNKHIPSVYLALNGRNIVRPGMKIADENVQYPSALDFGLGINFNPLPDRDHEITLSSGIYKTGKVNPRYSLGLEYDYAQILFLRSGLRGENPSFGAGLHYSLLSFDYALVKRNLGYLHVFNLTASFGRSVDERKTKRTALLEEEFSKNMRRQMASQAQNTIAALVEEGNKLQAEGRLGDAVVNFDRALFIARSNNIDTSSISVKAIQLGEELESARNIQQYNEYYSNARQKFNEKDLLAARYFAEKAIAISPDSVSCKRLIDQIDNGIREIESKDELVGKRVWIADSLLGCNKIDQAYAVIEAARKLVPGDNRLAVSLKRIKLEKHRESVLAAVSSGQLKKAESIADSALMLLPDHKFFIDLRSQIRYSLDSLNQNTSRQNDGAQNGPSRALIKEVERIYSVAKNLYEKGRLNEAIVEWEKIELIYPNYLGVRKYLIDSYKYAGIDLYGKNRLKDAIALWEKAIKLDPNNTEISRYIERAEFEKKRVEELSYGTNK
jgi:tetratricopeptide (TPR) repeat protein